MRETFALALAALGIGLLPVLSVTIAAIIADMAGCTLHEGNVNPCVIGGIDLGGILYTMGILGWLMLVSLPIAALGALGLAVLAVIALVRRLRR